MHSDSKASAPLVHCRGEELKAEALRLWRQLPFESVRLINAYGPTEATVTATTST